MEGEAPTMDTPIPENRVVDQIITLAIASAGCEEADTEEARKDCRVNAISPMENDIGRDDAVAPVDRLAEFFVNNPKMSDRVINRFQNVVNDAIDKAEVLAKDMEETPFDEDVDQL